MIAAHTEDKATELVTIQAKVLQFIVRTLTESELRDC
jgi:hypothetical protein